MDDNEGMDKRFSGSTCFGIYNSAVYKADYRKGKFDGADFARWRLHISEQPKRGDIIVFHTELKTETGSEKLLIKRIIGLPGDVIDIEDGLVYLNGELLEEDYIPAGGTMPHDARSHFEVPEDSLFCLGDNRGVSKDSRYSDVGYIKIDEVVGKAVIRLYPFNSIKVF